MSHIFQIHTHKGGAENGVHVDVDTKQVGILSGIAVLTYAAVKLINFALPAGVDLPALLGHQ